MIMTYIFLVLIFVGAIAAPTDPNDFFKNKTKIERPFELRDPFKPAQVKADKSTKRNQNYSGSNGTYTNIQESKIDNIQSLKVVGVLIGKERRALVTNSDSKGVVIVKEGMKVGQDGAELKAILPGGIILVEKIVNVYGQEEFLETVIPISK